MRIRPLITILTLAAALTAQAADSYYYATATNINLAKNPLATATGGARPANPLDYHNGGDANAGRNDISPHSPGSAYRVDLGAIYPVGQVELTGYTGGSGYDATSYSIEHSLDKTHWTTNTYVASGGGAPYTADLGGALARYVRLVGYTYQHASLWILTDCNIYLEDDKTPIRDHLSLNGVLSNNSPTGKLEGADAPKLNDEASDYQTIGNAASLPKTMTFPLDKTYYLNAIRWHVYTGGSWSRPTAYTVETSNGGTVWTQVVNYSGSAIDIDEYVPFDSPHNTNGILADWVRVTVSGIGGGGDGLYIEEMQVFGEPPTCGQLGTSEYVYASMRNVNLAKNRNATATGGTGPLNPLDHYNSGDAADGRCLLAVTPGTTYRVDLGDEYAIGRVHIQGYNDANNYDATSYSIEHSSDAVNWTTNTYVTSGGQTPIDVDLGGTQVRYLQMVGYTFQHGSLWILEDFSAFGTGTALPVQDHIGIGGYGANDAFFPLADGVRKSVLGDDRGLHGDWYIRQAGDLPTTVLRRLDKSYMLKGMRWHIYTSGSWDRPTTYTIEASDGGSAWTEVYSYSGAAIAPTKYDTFTGDYGTEGILADRVRIYVTGTSGGAGDGFYLVEQELFGDIPPPPPQGTVVLLR